MIKTKRLTIIPLEEQYLESLRQLRNDPTTNHWLTHTFKINKSAQRKWFKKLQKDQTKQYLSILMEKNIDILSMIPEWVFVGIIRSDEWDRLNGSVRVGCDIMEKYRGNGLGTEALSGFINYLFNERSMHRIWLLVARPNKIARKLYKKLGFKEEGRQKDALFRDGKYHDYISMSILEDQWKQ